jgi:hypothetical protein
MTAQSILRIALLLSGLAAASCAARPAGDSDPTDAAAMAPLAAALSEAARHELRPPRAMVVRLGFGAAADLDLYVTDPLQETVYYANTPARSGGALDADRGCGDPAPRVETVVFERPLPGRYRIGVDFPKSCDGSDRAAPYAVRVERAGHVHAREGSVEPRRFAPIVLELDVE